MINIGILGCADIAKKYMIHNFANSGKFNVKAIASRDYSKACQFASEFSAEPVDGYTKLIDDPTIEAVYIPLPTGLHYDWIMRALQNHKHVLAEKSFAVNLLQTTKIIEFARKNKLCVFENFMFPYHSQFDTVTKIIERGEIGSIRLLRSSFGFPIFKPDTNIRYAKELGGGALLDAGAYTLMAAQFFLGYDQKVLSSNLEYDQHEVDFFGSIVLKNQNGIISQLAFGFDNFYQNNIEIWGSTGKLVMERAFTAGPGFAPKIIIEKQNFKEELTLPADNHFIKIILKFADCIENNHFDYQFEQILNQSALIDQSNYLSHRLNSTML